MRAFLYCRVAHDDSFALEHQRFLLQLYAKQAGYTIIGSADEYGSGLTLDRPALQKVTEAVVAGKVDVVLVHNLTRIGWEWGMAQSYIDLLNRHKVKLLCIQDRLLFDENGAAPILTIKSGVSFVGYSNPIRTHRLVRVTGFEPAASCSQSRRATNCATPGCFYIPTQYRVKGLLPFCNMVKPAVKQLATSPHLRSPLLSQWISPRYHYPSCDSFVSIPKKSVYCQYRK